MLLSASRRLMKIGPTTPGSNGAEITAWLWIGCTLVTLVTSQQSFYMNGRYGKRADPGQASAFWSGSRYGRGEAAPQDDDKVKIEDNGKNVEVAPRTDRFFLGSRYGKRTFANDQRVDSLKHFESSLDFLVSVDRRTTEKERLEILTQEMKNNDNLMTLRSIDNLSSLINDDDSPANVGTSSTGLKEIACLYTGVKNLYRCYHRITAILLGAVLVARRYEITPTKNQQRFSNWNIRMIAVRKVESQTFAQT